MVLKQTIDDSTTKIQIWFIRNLEELSFVDKIRTILYPTFFLRWLYFHVFHSIDAIAFKCLIIQILQVENIKHWAQVVHNFSRRCYSATQHYTYYTFTHTHTHICVSVLYIYNE